MASKLDAYREEILELRKQAKSFPQISEELKNKYGLDFHRRTISDFYNKTISDNTFSKKLEENDFLEGAEW